MKSNIFIYAFCCQAKNFTNDSSRAVEKLHLRQNKIRYFLNLDCRVFIACSVNTVWILNTLISAELGSYESAVCLQTSNVSWFLQDGGGQHGLGSVKIQLWLNILM